MKISKILLLLFLFLGLFLVAQVGLALAQYVPPPYGEVAPGGQILIDKKIKDPAREDYKDNLGVGDYKFSPGEEIHFKITVKNNGETTFEKVKVKDILPPYVEFVSGTTEVEYEDIKADEAREFGLKVKVVPADRLPHDQGLYCLINKVEVVADDQIGEDTVQFCLEKKVLGAEVQPEAGANIFVLGLTFLGISALGIFLKVRERH